MFISGVAEVYQRYQRCQRYSSVTFAPEMSKNKLFLLVMLELKTIFKGTDKKAYVWRNTRISLNISLFTV